MSFEHAPKAIAVGLAVIALAVGIFASGEDSVVLSTLPLTALNGDATNIEPHPELGALLIVGFSRESSEQTREWGMLIDRWRADRTQDGTEPAALNVPLDSALTDDPLPVYNVSVMGEMSRLMRAFLRRMMKRAIPKEVEGSFFLAFKETAVWRELAVVENEDAAYLLRIDAAGRICARHVGRASDEALEGLLSAACR